MLNIWTLTNLIPSKCVNSVISLFASLGTLCSQRLVTLQILQVLIESICKQNLTAATSLTTLHLHDHLPSRHFLFLGLKLLSATLHSLYLGLMPGLLCFPFLPLAVCNVGHDFHALFHLLLLLVMSPLVVVFDFLLVYFLLLFYQTLLQPFFEGSLTLLLLMLFLKPLMLLLPQLLLLLESLSYEFALFPLVHAMGSILVLFV